MTVEATQPQHMLALQKGERIRLRAAHGLREARALRDTMASRRAVADLIEAGAVEPTPIERALKSCRGLGSAKVRRMLMAANVYYGATRVRDLTPRQREVLCELLRGT